LLTEVNGDTEIVRDIMLPDVDDAVGGLAVLVLLLRLLVLAPCCASLFVVPAVPVCAVCAHDIGVRVDRGELCRVGLGERQDLAADGLKVCRIPEEDLEEDWRCGEQVVWLQSQYHNLS